MSYFYTYIYFQLHTFRCIFVFFNMWDILAALNMNKLPLTLMSFAFTMFCSDIQRRSRAAHIASNIFTWGWFWFLTTIRYLMYIQISNIRFVSDNRCLPCTHIVFNTILNLKMFTLLTWWWRENSLYSSISLRVILIFRILTTSYKILNSVLKMFTLLTFGWQGDPYHIAFNAI